MPTFFPYLAAAAALVVIIFAIIQYRKSRKENFDKKNY